MKVTTVPHVKIYTTATCVYCRAEKQFLDEHNVPYEAIAVDEDQAAAEEMISLSGQMGVPFTVITAADGSTEHILGFDRQKLQEVLQIA